MDFILPWIVLLIGLLLVVVFTPRALGSNLKKERLSNTPFFGQDFSEDEAVLAYLQTLEEEIADLKENLERIEFPQKEKEMEDQQEEGASSQVSFKEVLDAKQEKRPEIELYRRVFQASDRGQTVTEIAQELGRGKGEIEFILGLRR